MRSAPAPGPKSRKSALNRPDRSGADAGEVESCALGLLARREHSRRELSHKLATRGFPGPVIEQVLDDLQAQRALDDGRYAEEYVRSRSGRGYGPVRIRLELSERGVDASLIEAVLDPADPSWRERAQAAHRKRFGASPPEDLREHARQGRFLQQRGFTAEQVRCTLRGDAD